MITLIVAPVDDSKPFFIPKRSYDGDAGYDLTCVEDTVIRPGESAEIPTNLKIALPDGKWCMIIGRSSTFSKRGLLTVPGIIDNGWRGGLFAVVFNPGHSVIKISAGERLVQMIMFGIEAVDFITCVNPDSLPSGERGTKGFGSTGI